MSANRKLQTEIDRVMKKVEEGIEQFDDIWEKVHSANGQSLKEKYEGDLKKEIKKLQRLRDQIKSWLGSSDIKDKSALTEARKQIEVKMEEFKVCEKDLKTKAYSREGLAREEKLDPHELMKEEKRAWIQGVIEAFEGAVETMEVDLDKLSNSKPKSKYKEKIEKLEARINTSKWHISKLEQINRLLDNDSLEPSKLDDLRDEIDFLVESIEDEDGAAAMEHDDYNMYEELDLDALSLGGGIFAPDSSFKLRGDSEDMTEGKASADDDSTDSKPKRVGGIPLGSSSVASITALIPGLNIGGIAKPKPAALAAAAQSKAGTTVKGAAAPKAVAPTVGQQAKAAPAAAGSTGKVAEKKAAAGATAKADEKKGAAKEAAPVVATWAAHAAPSAPQRVSSGNLPDPISTHPTPAEAHQAQQRGVAPAAIAQLPKDPMPAESAPVAANTSPNTTAVPTSTTSVPPAQQHPPSTTVNPGGDVSPAFPPLGAPTGAQTQSAPVHQTAAAQPPAPQQGVRQNPAAAQLSPQTGIGGAPAVNPPPVNIAGRPAASPAPALNSTENLLTMNMMKMSMNHVPPPDISDRQKGYTPRTPYLSHPSFPTQQPSIMSNPALFERLPMDTLFLSFYYQQGSYQQYLSARQLKKHSWRFHKKYMTWFQRHEEPKVTTDDFEEGTYVYFDYESGWCQRIKSEFKFEYCFLEDELTQAGGDS